MKIAIIGSNPSSYNDDPDVPFKGAACEKRLNSWIAKIKEAFPEAEIGLINISNRLDYPFSPTKEEVEAMLDRTKEYDYLICLGGAVYKSCLSCRNHFKMQALHPSPRNRLWNDPEYETKYITMMLNELKDAKEWR